MSVRHVCNVGIVALSLCALCACSATKPAVKPVDAKAAPNMISHMDTDGDGKVSRDEAAAFFAAAFVIIDANGDGKMTQQEFTTALPNDIAKAMDTDRDGKVTRREFILWYVAREPKPTANPAKGAAIKHADEDGDGALSSDEFERLAEAIFAKWDANGDGAITQAETDLYVVARFKEFDINGDGVVTSEEFVAVWIDGAAKK